MKRIAFLLLIVLSLSGCKALYLSELTPTTKYGTALPPLIPLIDAGSFETVFAATSTSTSTTGYATGFNIGNKSYIVGNSTSTSNTFRNPTLNDLRVIFENDVKNNICEKYGSNKGYISCSVVTGANYKPMGAWWLTYCIGCGIWQLLGVPTGAAKTYLQIQVDIYDMNKNLIGTYTSPYIKDKAYIALYWGYSGNNALRKTAQTAFKECMDNIKRQIAADSQRLNRALN